MVLVFQINLNRILKRAIILGDLMILILLVEIVTSNKLKLRVQSLRNLDLVQIAVANRIKKKVRILLLNLDLIIVVIQVKQNQSNLRNKIIFLLIILASNQLSQPIHLRILALANLLLIMHSKNKVIHNRDLPKIKRELTLIHLNNLVQVVHKKSHHKILITFKMDLRDSSNNNNSYKTRILRINFNNSNSSNSKKLKILNNYSNKAVLNNNTLQIQINKALGFRTQQVKIKVKTLTNNLINLITPLILRTLNPLIFMLNLMLLTI